MPSPESPFPESLSPLPPLAAARSPMTAVARHATLYASYGSNCREPTRNDMFAGFDNVDPTNIDFVGPLSRVRPERVWDAEAGVRWRTPSLSANVNVFDMRFRNEITPVGELSYIGLPLRKNVRASYRRGLEADVTWHPLASVTASANATISRNRIAEYTDDTTGATYTDGTAPYYFVTAPRAIFATATIGF